MRTTYDREADAVYIALVDVAPGEATVQREVPTGNEDSMIVLDFDERGFLLGVEVLGASAVLRDEVLANATDVTKNS
jgi:uncharacterized protein YuzE